MPPRALTMMTLLTTIHADDDGQLYLLCASAAPRELRRDASMTLIAAAATLLRQRSILRGSQRRRSTMRLPPGFAAFAALASFGFTIFNEPDRFHTRLSVAARISLQEHDAQSADDDARADAFSATYSEEVTANAHARCAPCSPPAHFCRQPRRHVDAYFARHDAPQNTTSPADAPQVN